MHKDIEVTEYMEEGYRPLIDFESWRVAALRYCEDTRSENIHTMQKHDETDEVFVLLSGSCILFSAGDGDHPDHLKYEVMEPLKFYNVKRGVWHNHILDEEGDVLIVENRTTCDENSPVQPIDEGWNLEIQSIAKRNGIH